MPGSAVQASVSAPPEGDATPPVPSSVRRLSSPYEEERICRKAGGSEDDTQSMTRDSRCCTPSFEFVVPSPGWTWRDGWDAPADDVGLLCPSVGALEHVVSKDKCSIVKVVWGHERGFL